MTSIPPSAYFEAMKQIYPLEAFPDFQKLVNEFPIIVDELKKNTFWMKWGSDSYDPTGHCMFLKGDWTVCPVYFGNYDYHQMQLSGKHDFDIEELAKSLPERFPKTIELLKGIKSINFAAFSRLSPNSSLAPHKHNNPYCLIFHMGLIIPLGNTCGLKVGEETHLWTKPGDAVIFDDTFEHSAWNNSDEERIVLYVDFFEPNHYKERSMMDSSSDGTLPS